MYQSIQRPTGINVFGSYLVQIDPDFASLKFRVTRTEPRPADAFANARDAGRAVRAFLAKANVPDRDVRMAQLTLAEASEFRSGERKFIGYCASVGFHVLLRPFENLEEILSGIVDAGVDRVEQVEFKTSKLREIRAEARRHALENARAKAEVYASAAGVKVGKVLHIEDVNPETTRGHASTYVPDADLTDTGDAPGNPASILVTAAVAACFAIIPARGRTREVGRRRR